MWTFVSCAPEKPSDVQSLTIHEHANVALGAEHQPVAVINGETITLGEFERRIDSLAPFARARYRTVEQKQEYLLYLALFEVMADEAERQGYGSDIEVFHTMKERLAQAYLRQASREWINHDGSGNAQEQGTKSGAQPFESQTEGASLRDADSLDSLDDAVQRQRMVAARKKVVEQLVAEAEVKVFHDRLEGIEPPKRAREMLFDLSSLPMQIKSQ